MTGRGTVIFVRLLPVVLVVLGAFIYMASVQGISELLLYNLLPLIAIVLLAYVALRRGNGRWAGSGWRWPLAVVGFALPSLGLSIYLHYGYAVDMHGMVSESIHPRELFRYLPMYTSVAGLIGFAIGWIAGRNV